MTFWHAMCDRHKYCPANVDIFKTPAKDWKSSIMGIKPGPKRTAIRTGQPDRRQRDNKNTPDNTPSLKPHIQKKGD